MAYQRRVLPTRLADLVEDADDNFCILYNNEHTLKPNYLYINRGTCPRPCVAAEPRAAKPPCEPRPVACRGPRGEAGHGPRGPRGEAASCRGKAARGEAAYNLVSILIVVGTCPRPCVAAKPRPTRRSRVRRSRVMSRQSRARRSRV